MKKTITLGQIELIKLMALELKISEKELLGGAKIIVFVRMYNMGKVTAEVAAEMLKLTTEEFLEAVDGYNTSPAKDLMDEIFEIEFKNK
jgi:predicted HTH domain antitoxin